MPNELQVVVENISDDIAALRESWISAQAIIDDRGCGAALGTRTAGIQRGKGRHHRRYAGG